MTTVVWLTLDLSRPEGRAAMQACMDALGTASVPCYVGVDMAAADQDLSAAWTARLDDEPDPAARERSATDFRAVLYRAFGLRPKAFLSNPEMRP